MYFAARVVTHPEDLYKSRIMQRYAKGDHAAYCNADACIPTAQEGIALAIQIAAPDIDPMRSATHVTLRSASALSRIRQRSCCC